MPRDILKDAFSPRCPSADEWISKLWYIYTMEYYSAIKKNTFESVLMRWMKLEPITQSEASQREKKRKYYKREAVLMRWMKLEPITQSEVSQKEKYQYSILTHVYGI